MKVEQVISGINNKELKVQQLADKFNCSTRTVQTKIKRLGYIWNSKEAKYFFTRDDEARVLDMEFDSFFNAQTNSNSTSNKSAVRSVKDAPKSVNKGSKSVIAANEPDYIAKLLSGKTEGSSRVYRGYYFDKDVLSVLDRSSNKSELINAVLREEFKSRGLL